MKKPDSVIMVSGSLDSFFRKWLEFLKPIHNFSPREIEIAACLIKYRYEYSKVINDTTLLDKVTLGEDTRKKIREECNITLSNFQVILGNLKKNGFIVDNRINSKFIPNIKEDSDSFSLLIYFKNK